MRQTIDINLYLTDDETFLLKILCFLSSTQAGIVLFRVEVAIRWWYVHSSAFDLDNNSTRLYKRKNSRLVIAWHDWCIPQFDLLKPESECITAYSQRSTILSSQPPSGSPGYAGHVKSSRFSNQAGRRSCKVPVHVFDAACRQETTAMPSTPRSQWSHWLTPKSALIWRKIV